MKNHKVLFVSQEITPYLPETEMSRISLYLPHGIQEKGKEIRTFMPKYGSINERRNQLHEVIRLSGMNLIIDDTDHPLIIKVASIQTARMQVYFIDNEDYFHRKSLFRDKQNKFFEDNDERVIFFARGVLETVRKLPWSPDIVHCHGWITSLIPLYLKKAYHEDPLYMDSKVVYSVYNDSFDNLLNPDFKRKLMIEGITKEDVTGLERPDYVSLCKNAIKMSDAVIMGSSRINKALKEYIKVLKKPVLNYNSSENYVDTYADFYNDILTERNDED